MIADPPFVYLLWSHNASQIIYLRGVYLQDHHEFAKLAKKNIDEYEPYTIRSWIEKVQCNHFFGQEFRFPNRSDRQPTKEQNV